MSWHGYGAPAHGYGAPQGNVPYGEMSLHAQQAYAYAQYYYGAGAAAGTPWTWPYATAQAPHPVAAAKPYYPYSPPPPPPPLRQPQRQPEAPREPGEMDGAQFSCRACDRQFPGRQQLDSHTASHVRCSEPGCEYSASQRLVRMHKQQAHGRGNPSAGEPTGEPAGDEEGDVESLLPPSLRTGAKKDSPEEIERWVAERRARFPTRDNAQRTMTAAARLLAAGGLPAAPARPAAPAGDSFATRGRRKPATQSSIPGYELSGSYAGVKRRPLLRLLLERERHREKNLAMQCFRYIATHGFLQGPAPA